MPKNGNKKKDNSMTIAIIGLVGTIIAALLGSPLLITLIEGGRDATPTPLAIATTPVDTATKMVVKTEVPVGKNQVQVFSANFEDDKISGFAMDSGQWNLGKDKSNKVLEVVASGDSSATAIFGPNNFRNGIIEFKINFTKQVEGSGVAVGFRSSREAGYAFYMQPDKIKLGYWESNNDWILEPFSPDSERSYNFSPNTWYTVRIEARGTQINAYVDGNLLIGETNNQLSSGNINFSIDSGNEAFFDDVQVWALE